MRTDCARSEQHDCEDQKEEVVPMVSLKTLCAKWILFAWVCGMAGVQAQPFLLPTANRAIFEPGREADYFVGTVGKPWTSGTFGCVRSAGNQLHEGIDVKCIRRDKSGEPADPVNATADGAVVYVNNKASLSNFGKYVVIRHLIEGLEIYSVYSHLSEVRADVRPGRSVKAGENIAVMGRTAATKQGISKDRAHVHFELNVFINDRFAEWYKSNAPGQRNDHGAWNGQNLFGLDPRLILLAQHREGTNFSLLRFVRSETAVCRVLVRKTHFPYLKRYAPLVKRNPLAEKEGVAGYEIAINYAGVPFEMIPRAASEIKGQGTYQLLSVNEQEQRKNPARHLVVSKNGQWSLSTHGLKLLQLLVY